MRFAGGFAFGFHSIKIAAVRFALDRVENANISRLPSKETIMWCINRAGLCRILTLALVLGAAPSAAVAQEKPTTAAKKPSIYDKSADAACSGRKGQGSRQAQ